MYRANILSAVFKISICDVVVISINSNSKTYTLEYFILQFKDGTQLNVFQLCLLAVNCDHVIYAFQKFTPCLTNCCSRTTHIRISVRKFQFKNKATNCTMRTKSHQPIRVDMSTFIAIYLIGNLAGREELLEYRLIVRVVHFGIFYIEALLLLPKNIIFLDYRVSPVFEP